MPRRPRFDKKRHRAGRDLTTWQWADLELSESGLEPESPFGSDEERRIAWLAHRDELLEGNRPGSRPGAWWYYDAPEGAPDRDDYRGGYDGVLNKIVPDDEGDLITAEFELDRLGFLASRGLLSDHEIAALLAEPKEGGLAPYSRERAERSAAAVLEGLADRGAQDNEPSNPEEE